eukprot:16432717-Heterocapsa_arctica.AAC.1
MAMPSGRHERPEDATLGHIRPRLNELGCVEVFRPYLGRRELPHEHGALSDELGAELIRASVLKS